MHRKQAEKFRFRQVLFSRSMMLLSAAIRLDGVETLYTINMLNLMNQNLEVHYGRQNTKRL